VRRQRCNRGVDQVGWVLCGPAAGCSGSCIFMQWCV
jgi:hypothetical protein